ncbi:hypothetical protein IG611_09655 [Pectobacterium sp. A535-S3-A17]|uniref:hypothetical protein n=2 Tax=Pectobacterium TaxID=122277 RepID=UPI001876F871|nr:hypothetical protein [Pectobacterium quasiaquaticum]MBE5212573.1 hypothetical protein [Pectobacterium quasiaquaticum]MBE5225621.1 hypothetical protein [Pectobacterium quasiaquaticum]
MRVELINDNLFDEFLYDEYQIVSTDSATNEYDEYEQSQSLDYKRLVGILNENENIVLPAIDKTISIIFYNFSVWTKIKSRVNVFLQEPSRKTFFGKLTTSYQPGTESIYISMNLYEDKNRDKKKCNQVNEHEVYKFLLAADCSHEEATNLVLLHEIGHAIHHQLEKRDGYLLEPTTPEASFLNPFVKLNGECVEGIKYVTRIAHKAITESYADLYSCILVDRLYDSSRSDLIINALHHYRTTHKNESYYSYPSIASYLKDRNGREFNSFDEIHKYMSATIADNAVYDIGRDLSQGKPQLSKFIGVVNILHGLNKRKIDDSIECMKIKFPFANYILSKIDKKNPYGYHQDAFEIGCKHASEWIANKNSSKIRRGIKIVKSTLENKVGNIVNDFSKRRP